MNHKTPEQAPPKKKIDRKELLIQAQRVHIAELEAKLDKSRHFVRLLKDMMEDK